LKNRKTFGQRVRSLPPVMWIGLVLIAVLLAYNGITIAKYITSHEKEPLYVAENFYFESDMLKTAATEADVPVYTLAAGGTSLGFKLKNYTDTLRYSEVDVGFSVQITDVDEDPVSPSVSANICGTAVTDPAAFVIPGDTCQDAAVVIGGLEPGNTYLVSVNASPYAATLKGKFTIPAADNKVSFTISDAVNSFDLKMTVVTGDKGGEATIKWPGEVLPDNTDPLMAGATGTSHVINLEKNSSYTFTFFKTDPSQKYDTSHPKYGEFSVTLKND